MYRLVKHPKVSASDKKACAALILAYGYGLPVESHEISGPGGSMLNFTPPMIQVNFMKPEASGLTIDSESQKALTE
jgi:hypothetical protein